MREIKFRGRNKDIGWAEGQVAYDLNGDTYIIREVEQDSSYGLEEAMLFATIWYRVDKETVGQYTGLRDKNGKEIYEGDIVLIDKENQIKGQVKYSKQYASFILADTNSIADEAENLSDYSEIEVIGNIYENQGLLEKEGIKDE